MKKLRSCTLSLAFGLMCFATSSAFAHFGMVIPSQSNVMESTDANMTLSLKFWHPFENRGMNLEKPAAFQVYTNDQAENLLPALEQKQEQGMTTWQASYTVKRPGLYTFVMTPQPYFESAEDCFIVHITKAYVSAFGGDDNWDAPLGLKAEITPLANPNALYAGNLFQGRVLQNGKPVAGVAVEVEWYPGELLQGNAPSENMVTQTIKADDAGIFSFVAPREGWWGFAALLEDDQKIMFEGVEKDVEIGAVSWIYFHSLLPSTQLSGE